MTHAINLVRFFIRVRKDLLPLRKKAAKALLIKGVVIVSCLVMVLTAMDLFMPRKALAEPPVTAASAQTEPPVGLKGLQAGQERKALFYRALERLIDNYGEDHILWPDNGDRRLIETFL